MNQFLYCLCLCVKASVGSINDDQQLLLWLDRFWLAIYSSKSPSMTTSLPEFSLLQPTATSFHILWSYLISKKIIQSLNTIGLLSQVYMQLWLHSKMTLTRTVLILLVILQMMVTDKHAQNNSVYCHLDDIHKRVKLYCHQLYSLRLATIINGNFLNLMTIP